MRTVPTGSERAWRAGALAVHLRVTIGGVNVSSLEGRDWVHRARVSESVDDDVATCEIELTKQDGDLSLSPLIGGSKLNAGGTVIALGKTISIETAVLPPGPTPQTADWVLRFSGHVDEYDFAGETIQIKGRDNGGRLIDTMIEVQRVYGDPAGTDVEEVMQDILDDNDTGVTLYSANGTGGTPFDPGDTPGFLIREYVQSKVNVMEALQTLALMIGWRCTYRWNADTEDFELTFYEPDRAKTTADWAFDEGTEYRAVDSLGLDIADIRNAFRGVYSDVGSVEMTGDPNLTFANANPDTIARAAGSFISDGFAQGHKIEVIKQGSANNGRFTLATVSATVLTLSDDDALTAEGPANGYTVATGLRTALTDHDQDSIDAYGRRYMEITEASSSQIDSLDEMKALLAAAKSDLAEPTAIASVEVHLLPWAEIGDLWSFAPNAVHFDEEQKLAPQSLEHSWDPSGDATTTATLRGKVSGGRRHWLEREGGRGAAPNIDLREDDPASGVGAAAKSNGIVVTFDDPRSMDPPILDWAYTAVHIATTSNFHPTVDNLVAIGRQTRFEIGGLVPDQLYYAKAIHYDTQGNAAGISVQVSAATERVSTYHASRDEVRVTLVPNGAFSEITKGTSVPPDGWEIYGGNWTNTDLKSSTATSGGRQHETGRHSIGLDGYTDGKGLQSALFPVASNKFFRWAFRIRVEASAVADNLIRGYRIFDKAKALLGTVNLDTGALAGSGWQTHEYYAFITDETAFYAQVFFESDDSPIGECYVDRCEVMPALVNFRAYQENVQSIPNTTATVVEFDNEAYDNGDQSDGGTHFGYDTSASKFTAKEAGRYHFTGVVGLATLANGTSVEAALTVNGVAVGAGARTTLGASDEARVIVSDTIDLGEGDYVQVTIWHNHGGAINTSPGAGETFFGGEKLETPYA